MCGTVQTWNCRLITTKECPKTYPVTSSICHRIRYRSKTYGNQRSYLTRLFGEMTMSDTLPRNSENPDALPVNERSSAFIDSAAFLNFVRLKSLVASQVGSGAIDGGEALIVHSGGTANAGPQSSSMIAKAKTFAIGRQSDQCRNRDTNSTARFESPTDAPTSDFIFYLA